MADEGGHRIVVGIDGSEPSLLALRWAARQAELTGAALEAVTSWDWPTSYGWSMPLSSDYDPAGDARGVLDKALEAVRRERPKVEIVETVMEGHAAPCLVETSKGADLLVVGSRGHGQFTGMLLGSVSEHCVTNSHCPVLVFRDASG
jgi:nucleotide-binding universal stress UspA family protein